MRRTWTGAAAAALATAFLIPSAFAQETQQGKQAPASMESGQHRETGQGQMRERAGQPGAQAQTDRSRMGAEPAQGEREQTGKPAMKGESAQMQEPANRTQPGKMDQGQTGAPAQNGRAEPKEQGGKAAQVQERKGPAENGGRAERTGPANRTGQAETGMQNRQNTPQTGQSGRQMTRQNVQATGKTNLPHDKAAKVAQTLMASGGSQQSQNINVHVNVGANLPADVVVDPLPPTIVELVPEFRGYDYFVLGDEIVIVDPATRQVVEIIEDVG
jgi:hypothetical protein